MHPSESLLTALETGAGSQAKPLRDWWASAAPLLLRPVQVSPIPAVAIAPESLSGKPIVLALDDGTSDGKYSHDEVSAHGRKFSVASPGEWYLRAISVYAERYGGVEPPNKKLDIALCDSEMRPIAVWQKPYAAFPKREMEWVRLEVPPTKVPNVFYLALYLRSSDSDGIYVAMDNSTKGDSVGSRPGEPPEAFDKGDWMIRVELDRPSPRP